MRALLNAVHYGAGPLDEVRQARQRAAGGTPRARPSEFETAAANRAAAA
jgi:hypothetical protein